MSLTAFVSGASGFVGSNLVHELHQQGWIVHVLVRTSSSLEELAGIPVEVHHGDVTDADSIIDAMPQAVDAVFHVAASTNFWSRNNLAQDRVNIDGTQNMLDAAVSAQARRFVHTSSFSTWGFSDTRLTEQSERTDKTDWINYVRSKHQGEMRVEAAARDGRIDAVILNPGHILGPGDKNNWSRMIRMVYQGKMLASPPGGGNFSDVREVARAHIEAFHHGRSGEKYLLGGDYASFTRVVGITGELLGRKVPAKPAPAWLMKTWARLNVMLAAVTGRAPDISPESAAMVLYRVECDSSKAQKALNYQFTPIRTLLEDTANWMEQKGLLE